VSGANAIFTQEQHSSLVEKAVETALAGLTAEKAAVDDRAQTLEGEKATLATALTKAETQLDVLAAEKAAAEKAAADTRSELDAFKAEIQHAAEVEVLKTERRDRVKAANANLPEDFFSTERVTRWAEMAAEIFDAFVTDISAVTVAAPAGDATTTTTAAQARETAAFAGGVAPASTTGRSTLRSLLDARSRKEG
jgi:hypothetical protein